LFTLAAVRQEGEADRTAWDLAAGRQRATQSAPSAEQVPGRHYTPASPHRSVTVTALNPDGAAPSGNGAAACWLAGTRGLVRAQQSRAHEGAGPPVHTGGSVSSIVGALRFGVLHASGFGAFVWRVANLRVVGYWAQHVAPLHRVRQSLRQPLNIPARTPRHFPAARS
jgi:hypothetical protein